MEKTLTFKTKFFLTILFILVIFLLLLTANNKASDYLILILNLMAINIIFAVSLTFINGITGIFSSGIRIFASSPGNTQHAARSASGSFH